MDKKIAAKIAEARARNWDPKNIRDAKRCQGSKRRGPYKFCPKKILCGCGSCAKCRMRLYSITYWTIRNHGTTIVSPFIPKRPPKRCRCGTCALCKQALLQATIKAARRFLGRKMCWLDMRAVYVEKARTQASLFEQELALISRSLNPRYAVAN